MSAVIEHKCVCNGNGFCDHFKRHMTNREQAICSGDSGLSDGVRKAYLSMWSNAAPEHEKRIVATPKTKTPSRLKPSNIPCQNRGDKIREDISNLCGSRGQQTEIFSCGVHGECSIGRYCTRQTVKTCIGCDDFKPVDVETVKRKAHPFTQGNGKPQFKTLCDLMNDTHTLASMIPSDASCIIGMARSGLTPAAMIAQLLHLPLKIFRQSHSEGNYDLIEAGNGWRLTGNTGNPDGPVVLVDDTVMSGNSFRYSIRALKPWHPKFISAAVYVNPLARFKPDLWVHDLEWPHVLAWNAPNSCLTSSCAFDMDGILCRDCCPFEDDDGPRYASFLKTASVLYPVRKTHIPMIVTARLEKYRAQTVNWLATHGMACHELVMGPWADNHERARADIAEYKANHYKRFLGIPKPINPPLFFESCPNQAKRIAELSGGHVVCPAVGMVF